MPIAAVRRARLDVLTRGGHDGSNEDLVCYAQKNEREAKRAHVGASERTCAQVHSYKYTSPPSTSFEKLFLERWWTYVVERWCPLWVAPNALTFGGLMLVMVTYALYWTHTPVLAHTAPSWMYAVSAVLMFAYQTADGIDGKQARRTKSGSPLGEVVDHGCDAICTCVYGIIFVDLLAVGIATPAARAFAVMMMTSSRIFFAVDTVSSTYTGLLPVNTAFDVQEMQILLQISMIVFRIRWERRDECVYDHSTHHRRARRGAPARRRRGVVRRAISRDDVLSHRHGKRSATTLAKAS